MKLKDFAAKWMGKVVTFDRKLVRDEKLDKGMNINHWQEEACVATSGWVVGVRWLQQGYRDFEPEYGHTWTPTGKSTPAVLVVPWPTMKGVPVPLEALTLGGEPKQPGWNWREQDRAMMRDEMKNWPRGKDGRWQKARKAQ